MMRENKGEGTGISRMLTVKEVGEILGFGKNKTYSIIAQKSFPKTKIGRDYRIPENEFEKWIKQNLRKELLI